jgi:hypothetical protein
LDAGKSLQLAKTLGVAVYREGKRAERGELTLAEAAARFSQMTVLRMIRNGVLPAQQRLGRSGRRRSKALRCVMKRKAGAGASRYLKIPINKLLYSNDIAR